MKKKTLYLLAAVLTFGLAGCGQSTGSIGASESRFADAVLDQEGNIRIEKAQISENATFVNYTSEKTTLQLIAVKASDDTVHLAYNTCQNCNPSPMAYFVQEGDRFICQNCGNAFTADQVGAAAIGCNPTTVDGVSETEEALTIDLTSVEQNISKFSTWQGPIE